VEELLNLAIILLCILAAAAVSRRVQGTIITMPMIYVVLGLLLSDLGLGVIDIAAREEFIQIIAEFTLILVLAADAARINIRSMLRHHALPTRLLSIGLPLTMFLGTAAAVIVFDLSWATAAILGILLAPTDASLGQAVISNKLVPLRIRQTLNVESGLNDGIAMPFLLLAIAVVTAEGYSGLGDWMVQALTQIGMGVLAGVVVGFLGAKFITWGRNSGWITPHFRKISVIALALLTYVVAVLLGGNGFIAAFVMGLTIGNLVTPVRSKELAEHVEVEVDLAILLTFMVVFGAVMLPDALRLLDWRIVLYALLSLTLVRMIPVAISLLGAGLRKETVGFIGWFGPRGTASILYLFTVIEAEDIPGLEIEYAATLIAVLFSVFAHGITAAPGARWFGKIMSSDRVGEDAVEVQNVPAMPERGPQPEH
jgi:NhaP-type Na+/H+ or K+/H+ antiporter